MRTWLKELGLAVRRLSRRPGFTGIAATTLGLGIGASVAIFAVVNAILLRPLPFPEPERIVHIRHHAPGLDLPDLENSLGTLAVYRETARSFSALSAYMRQERNLTGGDRPERVRVLAVEPSFFDVLRIQPVLGRRFREEDGQPGAPPVAVLTHATWTARFGRDPGVLGRFVELDGVRTEVVGILPQSYAYPDPQVAVLVPYWADPNGAFGTFGLYTLGRLAPGVSVDNANRELAQLQERFTERFDTPPEFFQRAGWSVDATPLRDVLVSDVRTVLWIVLGTVGFLLLVACASVANLFLVRAEGRQKEMAVRTALGASRGRIAGSLLSESLLLGAAGGVLGTVLAWAGVRALVAAGPAQLPRLHEVGLDAGALLLAAALSVGAGLAFGLLPLPRLRQAALGAMLREGRGHIGGRDRQRVRKSLITAQIALALMLLTGSGLMLRSFGRLRAVEPGFRTEGVLTVGVSLGEREDRAGVAGLYQRIVDEVRGVPGAQVVGATNSLPILLSGINGSSFNIEAAPRPEGELPPVAMYTTVTDGYFEALGMRLLEGRSVERADHEQARPVIWVNRSLARQVLGDRALGQRLAFGGDSTWLEVVGVVEDVRTFGLDEDARMHAYMPMTTHVTGADMSVMHLVVRTAGDPMAVLPGVRETVRRVDPEVPLTTARTMEDIVAESMVRTSFTMTILLIAALVALLLGAVGLYGVIGYVVSQRTQEIGIRIALGAVPGQVRGMVLRQGLALALVGVGVGLAGAVGLSRLLEAVLFEVSSRDPLTFGSVAVVLLAVSALATWLPARRASAVSPLEALRGE